MNEEEKKAIERINKILEQWQEIVDIEDEDEREFEMSAYAEEMPFYEMKTLLNLIQKQEKVIDKMAECINELAGTCPLDTFNIDSCIENICGQGKEKECWKKYFKEETKDE